MDQASFFYHSSDQMIAASWCYGGYGLLEWPEDWTGLLVGRQVNRTRAPPLKCEEGTGCWGMNKWVVAVAENKYLD